MKFNNILKKGSLQVYKIDSEYPDNKLSGAVFEVYDSNKNVVGTLTEIEKGLYRLDNIPYGDYTLKEITSPTGFLPGPEGLILHGGHLFRHHKRCHRYF